MAAHLHDSVLQTLALIQRNADRPRELAALARRQERELRSWLYGDRLASGERAPQHARRGRRRDGRPKSKTCTGSKSTSSPSASAPSTSASRVCCSPRAKPTVNAAKHAGVDTVSLYVEAEPDRLTAFVRDRGSGFDPQHVPDDRRGIAESIRQRMARNGGTAVDHVDAR